MRWNCSRTESNEALIHLSISGETERENDRSREGKKIREREKYQTEEETKRRKIKQLSAEFSVSSPAVRIHIY